MIKLLIGLGIIIGSFTGTMFIIYGLGWLYLTIFGSNSSLDRKNSSDYLLNGLYAFILLIFIFAMGLGGYEIGNAILK